MPADQLAHLEGCVSFRIDESISHRCGLTAFQVITNPATIASDPDLPIYSSKEALLRKLTKNHNAPAGTSRVVAFSDLDYALQRRFRRHVSYSLSTNYLLAFDTPLVVDAMMTDPAIFDRVPSLPCLSEDIRKTLISRFPNKLRVRQKSLLLGLPCVCRPTPTKSGLMRKSQAEAMAASRTHFLHERGYLIPFSLYETTVNFLDAIFSFDHPHSGDLDDPDARRLASNCRQVLHTSSYWAIRRQIPNDPTWEQEAVAEYQRASSFAQTLKNFCQPSHKLAPLARRRWPHILRVLSLWHPYLPWLVDGFPPPHTKFSQHQTNQAIKAFRSIRTRLFQLLRTWVPSHHFTPGCRLVRHPHDFHSHYPHPFDFLPTYPYPSDIHNTAQRDRLDTYLSDPKFLPTLPLPPLYPDPIPVLHV